MATADTSSPTTPRLAGALPGGGAESRKKMVARRRLRVRVLTVALAVLLVMAAVIAAWPRPAPVEEAMVRSGPLQVTIDEPGKTRVRDRYIVYAPLGGDLARIMLRAGDPISAGAPLARILPGSPALLDPRARAEATARVGAAEATAAQAKVQVARAQAAYEHAAQQLETTRRLVASGAASQDQQRDEELDVRLRSQELEAARFAAVTASHDVDVARAALQRYGPHPGAPEPFTIESPVSGRVLKVDQQSAGMVAAGAPLIQLGDPSSLEIVVDVLTADAVRIPPSAPVRLLRWGGDQPLHGHVRLVEPSAFTKISALGVEEQRVSVIVEIDDPREEWQRLGDGYRVEASIVVWQQDGVIVVPASATFRRGEEWAVFVDERGRARLRDIRIGQRGTTDVQVVSGLAPGERVVLHPSSDIRPGVRVKAQ